MSKTAPEEANELARKHGINLMYRSDAVALAALIDEIDEVRRVDAEPVGEVERGPVNGFGYATMVVTWKKCSENLPLGVLHKLYTHPAPSHSLDAEPVWPNPAISTPFLSELKRVNQGDYYSAEQVHALINAYNNLYRAAHPAPSQPAAPVELPVVAWVDRHEITLVSENFSPSIGHEKQSEFDVALVLLSDAQAAIAAGRKAS